MNTIGYSLCFSQYDNDSLCIELVDENFDLVLECTVETDSIDDFEEVKGFSERKNDGIRGMHRNNLIVAIKHDFNQVRDVLLQHDIIQETPLYLEMTENETMLAYYQLTSNAIDQKCEIIDGELYTSMNSEDVKRIFSNLPYNHFLYKWKDDTVEFVAICFNRGHSYFECGTVSAKTIGDVRDYLAGDKRKIQHTFWGTAKQIYLKLFYVRRRVSTSEKLIK